MLMRFFSPSLFISRPISAPFVKSVSDISRVLSNNKRKRKHESFEEKQGFAKRERWWKRSDMIYWMMKMHELNSHNKVRIFFLFLLLCVFVFCFVLKNAPIKNESTEQNQRMEESKQKPSSSQVVRLICLPQFFMPNKISMRFPWYVSMIIEYRQTDGRTDERTDGRSDLNLSWIWLGRSLIKDITGKKRKLIKTRPSGPLMRLCAHDS